jgi:rhamnosyltransferase
MPERPDTSAGLQFAGEVTVAIPVRDGGQMLRKTLAALASQTIEHELLICDSGSQDGSVDLARAYGARVLEIAPRDFNHGGTRNLLIAEASGAHVALLTQDAEPIDEHWLGRLLEGFDQAPNVGIVYGPYTPRPDASPAVRMEIERWFSSLSRESTSLVERLSEQERTLPVAALLGRRGFFTDADACVARHAWKQVPFREVPYAEDRVLAVDMLRAGYAKVFVPAAAVWHSHDYTTIHYLRRCFDEWRGLREVYGWREPAMPAYLARSLRGQLGQARRELAIEDVAPTRRMAILATVGRHHLVRLMGALLGSRADALPVWLRRGLSLEGRGGFSPVDFQIDSGSGRES